MTDCFFFFNEFSDGPANFLRIHLSAVHQILRTGSNMAGGDLVTNVTSFFNPQGRCYGNQFQYAKPGWLRLGFATHFLVVPRRRSQCVASVTACVCMSVCLHSKRKTASAIDTRLYTHVLHGSRLACVDPEVKRSNQGHMVTKTVTVAWAVSVLLPALDCMLYDCSGFQVEFISLSRWVTVVR